MKNQELISRNWYDIIACIAIATALFAVPPFMYFTWGLAFLGSILLTACFDSDYIWTYPYVAAVAEYIFLAILFYFFLKSKKFRSYN